VKLPVTPLELGLDNMWDNRILVHILYRIVTAFHVLHTGLGFKLELTKNEAWGEHCRKEALTHVALGNKHLSDGRMWLLGGAMSLRSPTSRWQPRSRSRSTETTPAPREIVIYLITW
jgi:glutathione S-transferase